MKYLHHFLALGVCALIIAGCVRHMQFTTQPSVEIVQSTTVQLESTTQLQPTVYLNIRDASFAIMDLQQHIERHLQARGYTITENPAQAGYIVQLHIRYTGEAAPQAIRQSITLGYGGESALTGEGATALVADVFVAGRVMPESVPRRSAVITSVSTRSAVQDVQWRVASMVQRHGLSFQSAHVHLEEALAKAVVSLFPAR